MSNRRHFERVDSYPAKELISLQNLIDNLDSQHNPILSHKEIEEYFQKLILAASAPDGYKSLCWKAGEWLLLLSDDMQNTYFNSFGYKAISVALSNAIENGDLPDGLGWYASGFVPLDVDGDIMLNVLSHSTVHTNLTQYLSDHEFSLNLDRLDPSDKLLGEAVVKLLSHLHRFGMDYPTRLMWTARLMQHLSTDNPVHRLTIDLVLKDLIQTQRYINAFHWLQEFFSDNIYNDKEDTVFEVTREIVNIASNMDEGGDKILTNLSYDEKILHVTHCSKRAQLLLGFVILWLLAIKGLPVKPDLINTSVGLLWEDYPNMSRFIGLISSWAFDMTTQASRNQQYLRILDYFESLERRAVALNEIKQFFDSLPNYRGRQLAIELWKESRDKIFSPLVSMLEVANDQDLDRARNDICRLDPNTLIDTSETFRYGHHANRIIDGKTRHMIANDFREYIDRLTDIADLSHLANVANRFIRQLEHEIEWGGLYRECDSFTDEWTSLEDYVGTYFLPIVDACVRYSS